MEKLDLINIFIKMLLIGLFTFAIYEKIINSKSEKKYYYVMVVTNSIISIIYIFLRKYLPSLTIILILYTIYGKVIKRIKKEELNTAAFILASIISYTVYLLAVILAGIITYSIFRNIEHTSPISLILIIIINNVLFWIIFKIKRLKNGFNFVNSNNSNITASLILIVGMVLLIFGILQGNTTWAIADCILGGSVLIMLALIIWIKSQITKTYKSKMRDRTIEIQKTEIEEKNKILEEVKEENLNFATTIHKYNKKISALEYIIKNRLEQETNTEFANELAIILKETKETAENFAKETEIKTNKLPETNVLGIDTMLKYMQEEARKKNINFDVKLNISINSLLENTISKDKFETLIGDHLKDAIIAVDASKNTYKSILVTMGLVEGIYEFSVYDTGIEFEIETLLKLGEEQITTHKETGGSGIGFMTTFETLKECKASLIIEEYNPETTSYTKCITIKFDGKNKYKIYSYRANEIKEHKHKRKITIEELK